MATETQTPRLYITWKEALTNYSLSSSVLHTIAKTPSYTDAEFEAKYNVMETMKQTAHKYGRGVQFLTLGSLIMFCMKSNMIKTKVFAGFMYTYWISHFYTLGSHFGIWIHQKWACDKLNLDPKLQTGKMTQTFIRKLRERNENIAKGLPHESENEFLKEFYLMEAPKEVRESFESTSYVANDYFQKNYNKYVKNDPNDNDPTKVFNPQTGDYEEQLKVPLIDCFFTRYVYHNTVRFSKRFLQMVGLAKE